MEYWLLLIGFALLIKWADLLIDGASSIAKKLKISDLVIWLTIVAFGTSAPELVINVISSISGSNGIVIGNIFWSNLSNILLILWTGAIIEPLSVKKQTAIKDVPFGLLSLLVLWFMLNDFLIEPSVTQSILSRTDGLVLLGLFIVFLYYTFEMAFKYRKEDNEKEKTTKIMPTWKSILFFLLGLGGLIFGWDMVVNNAVKIATNRWWSEKLIGLTIVAIWTSLPELVTTIVAVAKKSVNIAIWWVIWSNIFNLLFVLATSAVISPIVFDMSSNIDLAVNIVASFLLFVFLFNGKKYELKRREGIIFLLLYFGYITTMIHLW